MFASYGDYTAVQSNNNHIVVCKNDKVVEFINYTRKATDVELLDIMMKHSESAALGGTKPHDNVMTFTDALTAHIERRQDAEIIESNDETMTGIYKFESNGEVEYVVCFAAAKNGTFTESVGEISIHKDLDEAMKEYENLSDDMKSADKHIEALRKRGAGNERTD